MTFIVAIRTRATGEWFSSDHFASLEIRGWQTSSLTSVAKDNLVLEIFALRGGQRKERQ